ncbi:MAG: dihydrolipoyl dehydrogenase [Pyrinomonadaceae bacterium]|nr:dihydrolipoyl dehydrogenase [Pyrinomonadaceae bacterium]
MATETFDVVIIGAGPGGYVAAVRAAQLGLKTAIIEKDKRLGGTCGLRGCIPTKQLLMSAHLYEQTSHLKDFGINVENVTFDFDAVQKRKERIVAKNASGVSYLMKKNKVNLFNGFGKILGAGKVEVKKEDGSTEVLDTKNIIIATGSVIKPFPGFEVDGKQVVNSDQILELQQIPKSLLVLGAGAVGVEFASVYSRFGAETTLIEYMPRLLPIEDEEVSKELERSFRKRGIKSQTGTKLERIEKNGNVKVFGKDKDGKEISLEADMLLVAVGRMPYLEGLGLENTKVRVERGNVQVDKFCRTDEPNVFAIGDAIPTPWLAHLASKEGIMVVEQIAGQHAEAINMRTVPNCTYCDPEVASVGLTEAKAREEGYDVKIGKFPFSASGKARILGEEEGFVKIISEGKYDEILGVHIIGPHATELLAEACVAMHLESTSEELGKTIHAHPTVSESIMEAAEGVHNLTIHL